MSSPTTRKRTATPDPLVSELMRDYGFKTEAELKSRLSEAEAWARKHRLALVEVLNDGDAEGFKANIGPEHCEFVRRFSIGVASAPGESKSARHRKLVAAATALFVFSHPLLRRYVEAGECEQNQGRSSRPLPGRASFSSIKGRHHARH